MKTHLWVCLWRHIQKGFWREKTLSECDSTIPYARVPAWIKRKKPDEYQNSWRSASKLRMQCNSCFKFLLPYIMDGIPFNFKPKYAFPFLHWFLSQNCENNSYNINSSLFFTSNGISFHNHISGIHSSKGDF